MGIKIGCYISIWTTVFLLGFVYKVSCEVTINPISGPPHVNEGNSVTLICNAACNGTCSYTWLFSTLERSTNQNYSIPNVTRKHAGVYTCKVEDLDKIPKNKTHTLDVYYPPDVRIAWSESTKTLKCTATGNPTTYTFSPWKHSHGTTVIRRNLPARDTIILNGTKPYMETGTYTCSVSNEIADYGGTVIQTAVETIIIQDVPILLESVTQTEYNVSKGSNLTINIKIYALPSVTRNDVTVKHSNDTITLEGVTVTTISRDVDISFYNISIQITGEEVQVHFNEIKEEYFGEIVVEMKNSEGTTDTTISLNPQGPPDTPTNITYTPDVNFVKVKLKPGFYNGANQTFYVEYSSHPNATDWNNNTFVEAGSKKGPDYFVDATVVGLEAETTYYLRLKGVNMYGESAPSEIVTVKTLETARNVGAIVGGAIAGGVVVIVIIILVICILKVRRQKASKKPPEPIPLPNILDSPTTSDLAPIVARSPLTNVSPGATNSAVYENTFQVVPVHVDTTDDVQKEHVYSNTGSNGDSHYQNFNSSEIKNKIELSRQESTEPKYSNYYIQNRPAKEDDNQQRKDHADEIVTSGEEQPYLDMQLSKNLAKKEDPYLEMEVKASGEDYMNVEGYKKSRKATKSPIKKPPEKYESMHVEAKKRESIPDYVAPPPPPPIDQEDYMNLNLGRKS